MQACANKLRPMNLRRGDTALADAATTPIPAQYGTYALLLTVKRRQRLTIGRLGALAAAVGCYVYSGSAFGPGGLRARLRHHLGIAQRLHWQIDYPRRIATLFEIWYREDGHGSEHLWAQTCANLAGASLLLPRFGASDCTCTAHLFHFSKPPSLSDFAARLPPAAAARRKIHRVTAPAAALPALLRDQHS